MNLIVYGVIALAILGSLGGIAYGLDHRGYERGKGEIQQEWDKANAAAQKKAEADMARQDAIRQAQDVKATRRLANEKKRTSTVMASLDGHIRAAGLRADCRITDGLLNDANLALAGSEGISPGAVPAKPGAVATPR